MNKQPKTTRTSTMPCRYGLKCRNKKNCMFMHPEFTLCKFGEHCRNGETCMYYHPEFTPCKFGNNCRRKQECKFLHPQPIKSNQDRLIVELNQVDTLCDEYLEKARILTQKLSMLENKIIEMKDNSNKDQLVNLLRSLGRDRDDLLNDNQIISEKLNDFRLKNLGNKTQVNISNKKMFNFD